MTPKLRDGRTHLQCIRCGRAFPVHKGAFTRHSPLRDPMCAACLDLRGGYIGPDEWADRVRAENYPTEAATVWGADAALDDDDDDNA